MKKILFFLIAFFLCLQSYSQIVRVGNGTDTCTFLPFSPSNWNNYSQEIILASEIHADSTSKYITDIGFDPFNQGVYTYELRGMTILIGNTTANSLSQGYLPHSQMSVCKTSNFTSLDNNIPLLHLDVPFEWDRTSNIVIAFLKNSNWTATGGIWGFLTHTTIDSLTKYDITSGYSVENPPTQGVLTNQRLNFQFKMIGCFKPDSIHFNTINSNSVDFSIIKKGDATNWEAQYKLESDTSWINAITITSSDTNIYINNLLENTYYNVRVRSVCSQWNKSEWIESEFKTKCESLSIFPFYEDFSGNICWENLYNTYFKVRYDHSTGISHSVSMSNSDNINSYLVSPPLNSELDSLNLTFKASGSGILTIGVMNNTIDTNNFHPFLSITNPNNTYNVNVKSMNLQGLNNYICFKVESGFVIINSITIDKRPNCSDIYNFQINSESPTSITLNWDRYNDNHNGFQVAYNIGDTLDMNIASIINLNDSVTLPFKINGLLPSTRYTIGVKQNCSSHWEVKTENTYGLPAQLPYYCNFEDSLENNSWCFSNNINGYFEIAQDIDSTTQKVLKIHALKSDYSTPSIVVASRLIKSSGVGGYKLSFNTKIKNPDYSSRYLKVYVLDDTISYYGVNKSFDFSTLNYNGSLKFNNDYYIPLNYSGNYSTDIPYLGEFGKLKKLIFVAYTDWISSDSIFLGIDNIRIEENSCATPILSQDSIGANSIKYSWTKGIGDNAWWLYYKKSSDQKYDSVYISNSNTYTLTNLTQATLYKTYIVLDCDSNLYSKGSNIVESKTDCELIDSLPYFENFESYAYNTFMPCWYSFSSPRVRTFENSKILEFSKTKYAITPKLSNDIPINSTMLRFRMRKNYPQTFLKIGAINDVNNTASCNHIISVTPDTINTWQWFEVKLNNYNGNGDHIMFTISDSVNPYYYLYIDDISIHNYLPCSEVLNFSIDSVNRSLIGIKWDNFNYSGQDYEISYQKLDSISYPSAENIINLTDNDSSLNSYIIKNLEPLTEYRIGIRQGCGGPWSYLETKTLAGGANLPYFCDFSDSTEINSWVISNGDASNKWIIGQSVNQSPISGYSLYVSNNGGLTNTYKSQYPEGNSTVSASRLFILDGSTGYILNFNSRIGGDISKDYLKVYVVDEDTIFNGSKNGPYFGNKDYSIGNYLFGGNNGSNPTYPHFCKHTNVDSINNHTIYLPYLGQSGKIKKLVFVWNNNNVSDYQPAAAIDNISIIANNCYPPELISNNITNTSLNLSWIKHISDSSWYLYYKVLDSISYDSIHIINDTNIIINNLLPNTNYNLYIRKDCDSILSSLSPIITIKTLCNPIVTLPIIEDFEGYQASSYVDCWYRIGNINNWPSVSNLSGSKKALSLYYPGYSSGTSSYAILPLLDSSININSLFLNFKMRSDKEQVIVGIMSDNNDESTFDSIATFSTPADYQFYQKSVYFNNYTGNGKYIAFKAKSSNTKNNIYQVFIDDIYIDNYFNCFTPSNLTVSNITTDSVELNWTTITIPTPNCWLYYKKYTDAGFDSVYVTSLPYHLTNLEHSTYYDFYVRLDCNNNPTNNSDTITFQTQCGKISSFPYIENFDSYSNFGINYPICWSSINHSIIVQDNYSSYPSCLMLNSNWNTPHYFVSPQIEEDINLLKVKFKMKDIYGSNENFTSTLIVGVMSNKNDTNTFEDVFEISCNDNIMRGYEVLFNSTLLAGTDKYIAFKTLGNPYYFTLDDIEIDYIPQCAQPTQILISNVGSNHATINWLPTHSIDTAWYLYYRKIGTATTDSVYVNSIPYNLIGIYQASTYDVYVKTICSTGLSVSSHLSQFSTPCATISSIPFFENFDTVYWIETDMLPCWTGYSTDPYRIPHVTFTNNSPPNGLEILAFEGDYSIASTPQIDSSINISDLKVSLSIKRPYYYTIYLTIGVMSDPNDGNTFDSITSVATNHNVWDTVSVDFSNYTGNGRYISFKCNSCNYYIDDVLIDYNQNYLPLCPQPNLLSIANITDSSANFTWSPDGDETSWEISLDDTLVNHIIVNDTNYQFSNLTDFTHYTAYVRSNCVDSYSPWVGVEFTTLVSILEGEVSTLDASSITDSSAILSGRLISNGNDTSDINMGFLIDKQANILLTTNDVVNIPISFLDTIEYFYYSINNLLPDSTYYYTTYFTNDAGTVYGGVKSFTSLSSIENILYNDFNAVLFPNPASKNVKLLITNLKEDAVISLFDQNGKLINTFMYQTNQNELNFSVENYSKGVYYINIKSENIRKTLKLIVY